MTRSLLLSLFIGGISTMAWLGIGDAQNVRDFTGRIPTVEELREALKPRSTPPPPAKAVPKIKPGSRGIVMVASEPECGYYRKQASRGIKLVPDSEVISLSVTFAVNSATITTESKETLNRLGEVLKDDQLRSCCFQIEGHTDSTGPDTYNERLSEKRALSVSQYLKAKFQVAPDRMLAVGYGEEKPAADNETEEGKQKNRRVEVFNLGYARPEEP